MYLHEIFLQNTGPISGCHVNPPFDETGNPLPVVVVGPNGSGKTIFLSYIVDALTEFAKKAFTDIVPSDGLNTPFFRTIQPTAIRSGQRFSLSLLHCKANNDNLYYFEKSGVLEAAAYSPSVKSAFASVWNWSTEGNHKDVLVNEKTVETEMTNGAHAFFPASRREDPDWLNPKSLKKSMGNHVNRRFNNELDKPLWIGTCAEENISWVLDVFLDSLVDFDAQQKVNSFVHVLQEQNLGQQPQQSPLPPELLPTVLEILPTVDRLAFVETRKNVERILQAILQDETVELKLNFRNAGPSRISIKMGDGRIIPTLQSLSEGQSQLFHLFATIIRYGERTDLKRSVHLSQITGLVIIDEIAAHLHPTLQHDILPELISLFPKVQFIVSSHSPLFLLGMEKRFGVDRVTILEMPDGNRINSERYSEFGKAFEYYQSTERFEEDIKQLIASATKPVVLTEGKTDARYIQTALELLGEEELLNSLDIRPVGQEEKYGGKDGLNRVETFYKKDPLLENRPILLLYDWDTTKEPKQIEKLWIRSIPKNSEDAEEKRGIENLFPSDLFKDCFYEEKLKKGVHGKSSKIPEFKKQEFCDWICGEKNVDHFAKFDSVVQILKEFIEANQLPPVQQPPPQ
ncbi:MAG: AAA family ATPase [Candidatus Poribacteria bacterium]|nr:AAA family ATPase [Candidatus Poribacteria bacterium]